MSEPIVISTVSPQLERLVRLVMRDSSIKVYKKDATTTNGRALVRTTA